MVGVLILFHISRDVCQFFKWETFWAEWAHGFGVNLSNQVLRLFHLTYQRWQEVLFVAAEIWVMRGVGAAKKRIRNILSGFEEADYQWLWPDK